MYATLPVSLSQLVSPRLKQTLGATLESNGEQKMPREKEVIEGKGGEVSDGQLRYPSSTGPFVLHPIWVFFRLTIVKYLHQPAAIASSPSNDGAQPLDSFPEGSPDHCPGTKHGGKLPPSTR